MPKELMIGGQAVLEGVMMRSSDTYAVAVRGPNGSIVVKKDKFKSITRTNKFFGLPFVRGMIMLYETLVLGIKAMNYSASQATGEEEDSGLMAFLMIAFSVILALLIFKFIPLLLATFFQRSFGGDNLVFNLIDGATKLGILILYLLAIGQFKDIKRVFEYHGAEHKAVACYEKKKPLTVANVQKESKEHPRCGTGFILFVVILSMLFYVLIPLDVHLVWKFLFRILLLPVIAGVSYELIRLSGKYPKNPLVKILSAPSLALQRLTTKEPDGKQVEVAIKSLKAVI